MICAIKNFVFHLCIARYKRFTKIYTYSLQLISTNGLGYIYIHVHFKFTYCWFRDQPLNLKGGVGGGLYFFSESKYFFRFVAQRKNLFPSNLLIERFFPKNKHSPPPLLKLNGCSLNIKWRGYMYLYFLLNKIIYTQEGYIVRKPVGATWRIFFIWRPPDNYLAAAS